MVTGPRQGRRIWPSDRKICELPLRTSFHAWCFTGVAGSVWVPNNCFLGWLNEEDARNMTTNSEVTSNAQLPGRTNFDLISTMANVTSSLKKWWYIISPALYNRFTGFDFFGLVLYSFSLLKRLGRYCCIDFDSPLLRLTMWHLFYWI